MENRKFFECSCFGEGLVVADYRIVDNDPNTLQIEVSMWSLGKMGKKQESFWDRLRWSWKVLTTGNPWDDEVILSPEEARKIGRYLLDKGNQSSPSDP